MKILISGVCGFVGSRIALALRSAFQRHASHHAPISGGELKIIGIDNLSRHGSWLNLQSLRAAGVQVVHGDVRSPSDLEACGGVQWVIDAAANPSVLAGTDQSTTSQQLAETNVLGTLNLLEYCKRHQAGMILLSTSRVYSIATLTQLPLQANGTAFELAAAQGLPEGVSLQGVAENCSTSSPISLYGSTKLAAEVLALEYHHAFDLPVWINRCGVLAGGSQFGRPDQGIFAYWLHSWRQRLPLRHIGFGGSGFQVRDCLHPVDLADLITRQILTADNNDFPRIVNVSGGLASACSLVQLSEWCTSRWGAHPVAKDLTPRRYDLPWIVLDHSLATATWGWQPSLSLADILTELADFADAHPDWLTLT